MFQRAWGEWGKGNDHFINPNGIAVNSGNMYVADAGNCRVQRFDALGNYINQWGKPWSGAGPPPGPSIFSGPPGVNQVAGILAICAEYISGNVYVADWGMPDALSSWTRVQKFNYEGNYPNNTPTTFLLPNSAMNDIAADSGVLYATDPGTNSVHKYDTSIISSSSPKLVKTWGGAGTGNGRFNNPVGIAVDAKGYVYVVDSGNNRVQKFDSSGNLQLSWPCANRTDPNPTDIGVDSSGNVYVLDLGDDTVQKFDASGKYVTQWGGYGNGAGQYSPTANSKITNPSGVGVDLNTQPGVGFVGVYSADGGNNRVVEWGPSQIVPKQATPSWGGIFEEGQEKPPTKPIYFE